VPKEYRGLDVQIVPIKLPITPDAEEEGVRDVEAEDPQGAVRGG
jgi:hypothetical protein